jgi:type I restriction-modification system DNA methylase subunit
MGRKERNRHENNDRVRELLKKDTLTPEEIEFIKKAYTGIGGLTWSRWDNGQFFTPTAVTEFVVKMMGIEGGRVLEPSCGGGAFLNVLPSSCEVYGVEMMIETARVAQICYPHATIIQGDALTLEWDEPFDYVIGNPPYGLRVDNWEFMSGKKYKSEIAFIEYGLKYLKPGGVLGMIVPDSILANQREIDFRKWVMDHHRILAVVSLPTETFCHVGTNVKTSLLMIEKGRSTNVDYSVFMAMCEKIGWDRRGYPIQENDLPEILLTYLSFEQNHIRRKKFIPTLIESKEKRVPIGQLALAI